MKPQIREPLTWSRLARLIAEMTPEQQEREVSYYRWNPGCPPGYQAEGYEIVSLSNLTITNKHTMELCEPGQPVLMR